MYVRRLVFVTAVALAAPAAVTAGPIEFNVAVAASQQTVTPQSPGRLDLVFGTQGDLQLAPGGSIELGCAHFLFPGGPQASDSYTANTQFHVAVAVTDAASGQSDTLHVYGAAEDWWDHREWDGRWTNPYHNIQVGEYWLREPFVSCTTLGGHEYVLRVDTTDDGAAAVFTLSVSNPEPAGLLLGAIALVPLGLRALRQRLTRVRAHDPRRGV